MKNKSYIQILLLALQLCVSMSVFSGEHQHDHLPQMTPADGDNRISLALSPKMKQHQLVNMRAHLDAVRHIVSFIADHQFEQASQLARQQLGLNPKMEKMCKMIGNQQFTELGLAFHQSAEELAEVLLTKNTEQSLKALSNTMNYCVQCHATFRQ